MMFQFVASKTKAALDGGLGVILCCGESLEVCGDHQNYGTRMVLTKLIHVQQREAEQTISVVTAQLEAVAKQVEDWSKVVIAYEPIWYVLHFGLPKYVIPDTKQGYWYG